MADMAMSAPQSWYLEGRLDGEATSRRFALREFPALIGRSADVAVPLPVAQVSTHHAEIYLDGGRLWLRDLDSSNGTFVNRSRVDAPVALDSGDVLHVASTELLLGTDFTDTGWMAETCVMKASPADRATGKHSQARALRELIAAREVSTVVQPIVRLAGPAAPAFEVLGRGARGDLPESPGPLFAIAEQVGLAGELSRCLRAAGLDAIAALPGSPMVYSNVHPRELEGDDLARDLAEIRARAPSLRLMMEVHESTVADPPAMRRLRAWLADLDIGLAYDDFGAGQARLLELAECPPDCLKFDMSLIRGIDRAPASRQRMVETLVAIACDMGVPCLAEGIETEGELEACRTMGFELAQGYFIARPAPAGHWRDAWSGGADQP